MLETEIVIWKIKQIFDGDYGCEELAEGQTFKVSVMLVDEAGTKKYITVEDKWLTDNGLDEGSVWSEDTDE